MCDDGARYGYYWSACMKERERRMGDVGAEDYAYLGAGCEETPWK